MIFLLYFFALEKRIYVVHSRTMKIVLYTMEPRLRASPRHGGQGFFLNCLFLIRRGATLRGGGDHRTWRRVKKNLVSYQNSSIFMGNAQLQAKRSRGFHPRRCGSPDAITPEQVLRHHRSAQGRHGGTGTVPSFIRTSILNFISMEKEFYRAFF